MSKFSLENIILLKSKINFGKFYNSLFHKLILSNFLLEKNIFRLFCFIEFYL